MTLALYRRYRPETFADVIGQEHVTGPLQQALRNDRVGHAYLFSGPRGCGKTTSARILARCLNCAEGPTATPCGRCQSCRDLSREGAGSLDVIEVDAASHGGVDDARDLRERASFSPAASRFKIYIIDEAHMVTPQGFNALLKVVEEPPPHLKFVFATTEPEKVIATIRSRTHHYPFRLVAPGTLRGYLEQVCAREQVAVEPGVLPLVVRAGAGSVRDAMSVLDQLIAGAEEGGLSYRMASALLGFTDSALLDEVVDAFAAGDGASAFQVIDRVVESGHDPRRFVADLLERLRDLLVLAAVPDGAVRGLIDAPEDALDRMRTQAASFGPAELSRAADLVNTGLTEMRGATAPRLQLELICARVLLPGAADDERALHARLDRLERRLAIGASADVRPQSEPSRPTPQPAAVTAPSAPAETPREPRTTAEGRGAAHSATDGPERGTGPAGIDTAGVRQMWPQIVEAVKRRRRLTWILLGQNAQVTELAGGMLTVSFASAGARDSFVSSGSDEILRQALIDVLGVDWRISALLDPSAAGAGPPSAPAPRPAAPAVPAAPAASTGADPETDEPSGADADDDDPGLSGPELLARELGAQVIEEFDSER